jgi:tetratricopeptide (TPR) repeat protein
MEESRSQQVARLLQEGLDHYGEGNASEAERCWSEVLFLDPENGEARDYLESIDSEGEGSPGRRAERGPDLAEDALGLMRAGNLEAALELFETLLRRDADALEVESYLEMVRSKLLDRYRERVGGLEAVPHVRVSGEALLSFNLPATTGFLLSLVDGSTSVNDLISLSGLDPFDTLRALSGLLEAGVVECPG